MLAAPCSPSLKAKLREGQGFGREEGPTIWSKAPPWQLPQLEDTCNAMQQRILTAPSQLYQSIGPVDPCSVVGRAQNEWPAIAPKQLTHVDWCCSRCAPRSASALKLFFPFSAFCHPFLLFILPSTEPYLSTSAFPVCLSDRPPDFSLSSAAQKSVTICLCFSMFNAGSP